MKAEHQQPFESARIFKASQGLLKNIQQMTARMNKAYKFTSGVKALDAATDLSVLIAEAYLEKEPPMKRIKVGAVLQQATRVMILLRVINDLQLVTRPLYCECIEQCVSVMKQAQSWEKSFSITSARVGEQLPAGAIPKGSAPSVL